MGTKEQKDWYRILTDKNALQKVIQLVSEAVMIQPTSYPKITKAATSISRDYVMTSRSLPAINPSNIERYLRTIANQIIETILQNNPERAIPIREAPRARYPEQPAQAIISLGDPRLGNQQLLLTPLSIAYGTNSINANGPQYITRDPVSREREREKIQTLVRDSQRGRR